MKRTLRAATVRHLLRHPAQLALALVGLALGVGTIVAVDIATASAQRAFELSLQAVNGAATHQLSGGPGGIDEQLYVQLRRQRPPGGGAAAHFAPVAAATRPWRDRTLELIGVDPMASAELAAGTAAAGAGVAGGADPRRLVHATRAPWCSAPPRPRNCSFVAGQSFELEVGGVRHPAYLAGTVGAGRRRP